MHRLFKTTKSFYLSNKFSSALRNRQFHQWSTSSNRLKFLSDNQSTILANHPYNPYSDNPENSQLIHRLSVAAVTTPIRNVNVNVNVNSFGSSGVESPVPGSGLGVSSSFPRFAFSLLLNDNNNNHSNNSPPSDIPSNQNNFHDNSDDTNSNDDNNNNNNKGNDKNKSNSNITKAQQEAKESNQTQNEIKQPKSQESEDHKADNTVKSQASEVLRDKKFDDEDFNDLVNDNEDPVYGGHNNHSPEAKDSLSPTNKSEIQTESPEVHKAQAQGEGSSPNDPKNDNASKDQSNESNNNGNDNNNKNSPVPSITYPPFTNFPLTARVEFRNYPHPANLFAIPLHEVWLPGRYFNKTITHTAFRTLLKNLAFNKQPYIAFFRCKTEKELAEENLQNNLVNDNQTKEKIEKEEKQIKKGNGATSNRPHLPMLADPKLVHREGVMLSFALLQESSHAITCQFLVIRRVKMTGHTWKDGEVLANVQHYDEQTLEEIEENKSEPDYAKKIKANFDVLTSSWTAYQRSVVNDSIRFLEQREKQIQDTCVANINLPGHFADYVAGTCLDITQRESQAVVACENLASRLALVLDLLSRDRQINEMREKIATAVAKKHNEKQSEHILKEQMNAIQKQLGVGKGAEKEKLLEKFRSRLSTRTPSPEALRVIEDEMTKFQSLESESMEYTYTRNYLEWLTAIPWGVFTRDEFDIAFAERVLNEDHYGLDDVKNRILEFIAVGQLLKSLPSGKILCLVGPPGVGKTSIGKSIARALKRNFHRIAVGGTDDVSEIKGHRRTYVGALPGKLVQALKRTECSNPVILIDEIDKIGRGWRGDPSAALLEVLDPEQNNAFTDHYLDVPVDLSKVLFICTANVDDTIPGPLRDRMEFIHLSGYVWKEKLDIAKNYLIPSIRNKTGVTRGQLLVSDDALSDLIRWYCREPGVRNLSKQIEKLFNKAALKIARSHPGLNNASSPSAPSSAPSEENHSPASTTLSQTTISSTPVALSSEEAIKQVINTNIEEPIKTNENALTTLVPLSLPILVTPSNLGDFVGKRVFNSDRMYEQLPVGVAMGLAWNSMGGTMIFIEATSSDSRAPRKFIKEGSRSETKKSKKEANDDEDSIGGHGNLFTTGQLGDVMKESSLIAYTVAKQEIALLDPANRFFNVNTVHLHVPEGATPKDGPSAGITMVTSLLSLALNISPVNNIAMTGELALTGKVLPIGGVKEKILAARRGNVTDIIFPFDNRKDVDELKDFVKEGLNFHYVHQYSEVRNLVFPSISNTLTKSIPLISSPVPEEPKKKPRKLKGQLPHIEAPIQPQVTHQ